MNTLQQANITEARYAVVLSEGNTPEADQKTVLTILAIEKSNPSIISSAELNDANNASHLQRAGCDVIVNSADLASKLLAMSLLNASVTQVVTDLITGEGNELYRCALPPRYVSKTFSELIAICKQSHDMVLIGIEREGKCLLNPASGMVAVPGDQLLVIAAEQPVLE
jgi:Trk K+ transport system NAD-binding subunit